MKSRNWIGGEWITPNEGTVLVKNPSNLKEEVGVIHLSDESQVFQAEQAAKQAFKQWSKLTAAARGEYLYKMAAALEQHLEELATLASSEMGKPITEMKGEVTRGIHLLRYYAGEGVRADGSIIPSSDINVLQYTRRTPLGVVGVITPWNFPVAIPIWKFAPALICGNTVIWKPAEIASLTASKMAEIFEEAGLPGGVLNLVIGKGRVIGEALLEKIEINGLSFTGSTDTGRRIAATCASRNIKYQTEMGGKNAAIVLNDADLSKTIPMVISGAFRSSGQKCTATSRIIVEKGIYPAFVEQLQKAVSEIKIANALDPTAYLGPVASKSQFEIVQSYTEMARNQAEVIAECQTSVEEEGYYIKPLIATGVQAKHSLVQEEIFGPVAVALQAENFEEAIDLCNQTIYGLSASLFTSDLSKAHRFLDEADAGMVRVNQETAGVEYQAPFGGMKLSSSHTREQGQAALSFYSEIKTCAIKHTF
ncbi:aldehyde dehydrogenase family protein [Chengkuizengella axinellae]|uniref:Aldehyde dehydrogenase family protein n=1 Tax=Chengkuizengella axinellae TaxID=3064388 RepID=A0ABT9J212_9BACL|nr:aldehyde dehydrogenase family protein [Chengkuizengella sp. 2205SS18-9]MDP5275533.1 aldehyde dehydrogenase family protein [Chengkuizengella sp. 2205SS18-9]